MSSDNFFSTRKSFVPSGSNGIDVRFASGNFAISRWWIKRKRRGGRERSIAATWRRKNRSEKLYFPLPRVTSARLKVNSCKYSSSSSLIIIYSILLLLFENFKTIQEISNKRKKEKEQNCNKNTNSRKWKFDRRGTVTITKKKGRDRVCRGDARCEMEDNWPTWVVGVGAYKKESLSLHEIARTCTNEQLRVLWQAANSSISHVFARICPRPSPFPLSLSLPLSYASSPLPRPPPLLFHRLCLIPAPRHSVS